MPRIEELDSNFRIAALEGYDNIVFRDIMEDPFRVYGVLPPREEPHNFAGYPTNCYTRMVVEEAQKVSGGVVWLNYSCAGGRVRFKTDSKVIAVRSRVQMAGQSSHFAFTGVAGYDIYVDEPGEDTYFAGVLVPPLDMKETFEGVRNLGECPTDAEGNKQLRQVTIHMPLYSGILTMLIGLEAGARLERADDYEIEKPVVYYGSSITQGGCASRPGNCYQNIISRELNCDHINLGFSGNALGEDAMADYIAGLDMSAFVYDYDHNAPNVDHLKATHERMFLRIREKQPDLPIIMMSRPKARITDEEKARREVIRQTYQNALARGDKNVYFIDGSAMMRTFGKDNGTVDDGHPNDLGFMVIATVLGEQLNKILRG